MTSAARIETAPLRPGSAPRRRTPSELLPRRPYPGLRPFEKAEWPIFRGRDRLIQDILTLLAESHFASVIGPSGSGKSSLVRAGVLAALERRHSRVGVRWLTGAMRPGGSPLWSMADGILRSLRPELVTPDGDLPAAEVARLRVLIDSSEDGLAAVIREAGLKENENLLLLIDQFEEIFRFRAEGADRERARLVELLVAVANERPEGFYIITTMRSDYLGDCARFTGLAETLNETHYLLPRMTVDELRQAITEPPALKNGHIEDDLLERLIEDVRAQEDQLPILQHTLLWMWIQEEEKRQRQGLDHADQIRLTLTDYDELQSGREVKNALSRHGDKILEGLSPEDRHVAEVMFRRLVEVEEHSSRIRRPAQCGTVARLAQVSLEVVQRVVDAFRAEDASFIFASRQRVTDDTSIDITHESLIRQWDRLDHWVRREKASYEVYSDLCLAARRMQAGQGSLLAGLSLTRAQHWLYEEQPTRLWARRYGGDFDAAISFLTDGGEAEEQRQREQQEKEEAERRQEEERLRIENALKQQALQARLDEQTKLARERRRFTRLAAAAAVAATILAATAGVGFWQARAAAIEAEAGSFWSRLQLFGDPLRPEAVATLWELRRADADVRTAFVRRIAHDHQMLQRFGWRPLLVARAVGLQWPDAAREIVEQTVAQVASNQFDPNHADPFELVTYTRALAALAPRLDPRVSEGARANIARAINAVADEKQLSDRWLSALAESVAVFGAHLEPPVAIEHARDRLRAIIAAAEPADAAGRRGPAISRAIEVEAPVLSGPERLHAVRDLVPLLGENTDSWSAKAIPRTLAGLLPSLDAGQAVEVAKALPAGIAKAATDNPNRDNSYLLTLMLLADTVANRGDAVTVPAFGQALAAQLALPNEPLQRSALVRAAVSLLPPLDDQAAVLASSIAEDILVPRQIGVGLDPTPRSLLRRAAQRDAETALQQAFPESQKEPQPAAVLKILHADWSAEPADDARPNPNRRAAQLRLLELLAPSLTAMSIEATTAEADLLQMLSRARDYLVRAGIARALAALPTLPEQEREKALAAAKIALAKTGSIDEASAWAAAIAALLPADPRAATAEIVEALKDPTAAEAPTDVLLAGLKKPWPEDYPSIAGKTLPDPTVIDWLEAHLPAGYRPLLTEPPPLPADLHLNDATGEPG